MYRKIIFITVVFYEVRAQFSWIMIDRIQISDFECDLYKFCATCGDIPV